MTWALQEQLQNIVEKEQGVQIFPLGQRKGFALSYPNCYKVGMSNLGMHILYEQINGRKDTACERFFLPDSRVEKEYVRTNTPLMSLENQQPLYEFSLIGFAVSFEMDYFNLIRMLSLGKVTVRSAERDDNDPIVIAGGPCATFNPEPLADFVDVFVIGEGEETIHRLLDAYYEAKEKQLGREAILFALAQLEGLYVPRFYQVKYKVDGTIEGMEQTDGVPEVVRRCWIRDLDNFAAHTVIFTEDTEFGGLYLVEIARGCGRHCRFCMAGYCFRNPRVRSLAVLRAEIEKAKLYSKKVGLMGAAISDYPDIDTLCEEILSASIKMSVASFRADSVTENFVNALAKSGAKSLTLAPEAGSERLRLIINKGISEDDLFNAVDMGIAAGILHFRLYIMVGLPLETDEDVVAIVDLAKRIKARMEAGKRVGTLTLSVNPFIPKPLTPFQWLPMEQMDVVEARMKRIKAELKGAKGIELLFESPKESYIQGILARGDRRIGTVLYEACQNGGSKAFRRSLKAHGLSADFYLYRLRRQEEVFPWDRLDMGFSKAYLYKELENARQEAQTPRCFSGCQRCGVCH